ncbi:hypothetical protein H6784_01715 [Candidatus Nomurabacteria bacterium]|nr:hypothetical protein [Candidatus Kaiserbacteria bacterium]MCB9814112.1 hypothetical protein [Candidatus Nomurabacteria bacterium]
MAKITGDNKKLLKELNAQIKTLRAQLVKANALEGKDTYIDVKVKKNQGRFQKIKKKGEEDKALGKFFLEINVTAKQEVVFVPMSVASGKKTAGFMYQIEGSASGSIATAEVKVRGDGVTQVTLGTLLFAKIPINKIASFQIQTTIRGKFKKRYKIVFTRLNYKLHLTDVRYKQYLKEIHSDSVLFS